MEAALRTLLFAPSKRLEVTPVTGLAYFEGEGQSNMTGFNSVDDLPAGARKAYPNVREHQTTAGAGTSTPTTTIVPYILSGTGENVGGVGTGAYGETCLGGDSGGIGPTHGLVAEYDAGRLWAAASGVLLLKAATPGVPIANFRPLVGTTVGPVWKTLVYGRRALRASLASLGAVYHQAKVWCQGETDAAAARTAGSVSDPSITDHAARWEEVYAFDEEQFGFAPVWFVVQLARNYEVTADVYTAALNAVLKSRCRWTVTFAGGVFSAIVDNANGGRANCYFVEHNIVGTNTLHHGGVDMARIGVGIGKALAQVAPFSTAQPITTIRPVIIRIAATVSSRQATVTVRNTDNGTIHVAAVAAGAVAPTAGQIVAGVGGGIVAAVSGPTVNAQSPGSEDVYVLSLPGFSTAYDLHAVAVETGGTRSSSKATTIVTEALVRSWDAAFSPSVLTYGNGNRTVMNTAGATRFTRAIPTLTPGGKYYFESLVVGSATALQGVIDPLSMSIGGGANGTVKCGWISTSIQHTGGLKAMGAAPADGDTIQTAVDTATKEIWIRKNNTGAWNNTAGADPATGVGGLSISGLANVAPGCGLAPGATNGVTIRLVSADWLYAAPSGFGQAA